MEVLKIGKRRFLEGAEKIIDLGRQIGANLASRIDQKAIKNNMKKMMQTEDIWTRLGDVLEPIFVGGIRRTSIGLG